MIEPPNPPRWLLEREAWLKAGSDLAATVCFVAALAVSALVALAAAVLRLDAQETVWVLSCAFLLCIIGSAAYVRFAARQLVLRGGVQVDRF